MSGCYLFDEVARLETLQTVDDFEVARIVEVANERRTVRLGAQRVLPDLAYLNILGLVEYLEVIALGSNWCAFSRRLGIHLLGLLGLRSSTAIHSDRLAGADEVGRHVLEQVEELEFVYLGVELELGVAAELLHEEFVSERILQHNGRLIKR